MNERLEASVSGRVQFVMYRDYTMRHARKLGLVGEVKNLPNGTVYVIAEGPSDKLEKLLAKLHQGPMFARVEHIDSKWLHASRRYDSFDIAYAE